jgi:hypothetical protein
MSGFVIEREHPPATTTSSVWDRVGSLAPAIALAGIWLATLIASLFSPDLVSGTEQEHLPIAAFVDWLWAAIATGYVLMAGRVRAEGEDPSPWVAFAFSVVVIWMTVALASIFAPVMVTGTDPTRLPIAALFAPFAATVVTGFVCLHVATTRQPRS